MRDLPFMMVKRGAAADKFTNEVTDLRYVRRLNVVNRFTMQGRSIRLCDQCTESSKLNYFCFR